MDPTSTVGNTERTRDAGRTDGRTDGVKPIYLPTTSLCEGHNDIAVDALTPCVARLWAAMVLVTKYKRVLFFHEISDFRYLYHLSIQKCKEIFTFPCIQGFNIKPVPVRETIDNTIITPTADLNRCHRRHSVSHPEGIGSTWPCAHRSIVRFAAYTSGIMDEAAGSRPGRLINGHKRPNLSIRYKNRNVTALQWVIPGPKTTCQCVHHHDGCRWPSAK